MARKQLPGEGRGGGPMRTVDQLHAQLPLERRDVRTDPRLGPVDVRRCRGEPTAVHDGEKRLQPIQFHWSQGSGSTRPAPRGFTLGSERAYPRNSILFVE